MPRRIPNMNRRSFFHWAAGTFLGVLFGGHIARAGSPTTSVDDWGFHDKHATEDNLALDKWRRRVEAEILKGQREPNYVPIIPVMEGVGGEAEFLMILGTFPMMRWYAHTDPVAAQYTERLRRRLRKLDKRDAGKFRKSGRERGGVRDGHGSQ